MNMLLGFQKVEVYYFSCVRINFYLHIFFVLLRKTFSRLNYFIQSISPLLYSRTHLNVPLCIHKAILTYIHTLTYSCEFMSKYKQTTSSCHDTNTDTYFTPLSVSSFSSFDFWIPVEWTGKVALWPRTKRKKQSTGIKSSDLFSSLSAGRGNTATAAS